MDDLLFSSGDIHAAIEHRMHEIRTAIELMTPAQMNGATDDEIVANTVERFRIEPLVIHVDHAEAEHQESQVDVSHDPLGAVFCRGRPCVMKGNQITVRIPFTGEPDLFKIRPSRSTLSPPNGRVTKTSELGGFVLISLALPLDQDAERFNRWMESEIGSIQSYASDSKADVEKFNSVLLERTKEWVANRRAQLQKQGQLLAALKVPLRRSPDRPTPLHMPKRVLKPLPAPRSIEQEYAIDPDDYEFILNVLRHQSRSFEQTPSAYRKLDEEELRDVMLSSLNTHFEGDASGERFRRKGKTDICVEFANRAAFIGECKLWGGGKVVTEALNQLLGYLTWRDCRASLVLFNKSVKGFKALQDGMPSLLAAHPRFVRHREVGHAGEWRAIFKATNDDGRVITIHVFLVDLSSDGGDTS